MFDPKRIYEDRTPPPLIDAPRDASSRPRFTPTLEAFRPESTRVKRKRNRHKPPIWKTKGYVEWKQKMNARFGKGWRAKWIRLKKLTGQRSFNPDTDNFSRLKKGSADGQ